MPPKPGVIPLGPLRLGDVLGGAFATLGRYAKQVLGVGAAAYGGALAVVLAAGAIAYSAVADHLDLMLSLEGDENPRSEDWVPVAVAFGLVALLGLLAVVVSTALIYTAVPVILQEAVLGRPTTFSAVWRRAWSRMPAVIGTVLLTWLIAMIPLLLAWAGFIAFVIGVVSMDGGSGPVVLIMIGFLGALATAPLAVWLWVKFSLAPSAVVFENQGPIAAMRRSSQLVRGDWWRILGISLLAGGMAAVASYVIQLPFSVLGMFSGMLGSMNLGTDPSPASVVVAMSGYVGALLLGQLIGQLIVSTFPPLVTGLLYVDRRIRTENLGPVLAEAAAVPPQYTA
ncbi:MULTISPECIES: hypothetical protein [unclassified Streptomyces]|uniref:DUF7847 domain-containing protein n=1 Tax=unclassified Streptomyces TaxID=2593676 RepID=UPI00225198E5|nr:MULTISPECIES: hypothetical protein [unclassified Streptomyces]MCX5139483.1 hypothetical protein [Streptomyces sp. NBC_00338]WRZ64157.1 hypothetical protein OG408_09790 [Streptomyces sp. NBC_01257]WSU58120.1 hypothetical protein OG450_09755 [Streptomyces sp. NBC_01104]